MSDIADSPILPAHIEETVQAIARFHAEHHNRATTSERIIATLMARVGRPQLIFTLTAWVASWIGLNLLLAVLRLQPFDEAPFYWLQGLIGLAALYLTSLVLINQRRDDELSSLREQLTLELAILSEKKTAKIIELLEELRRDSPNIKDRVDEEATALSAPADPDAVLAAIKDLQETTTPEEGDQETFPVPHSEHNGRGG